VCCKLITSQLGTLTMRNYLLSILLGLTTTVAVWVPLPVKAEAKVYQEVSGEDSIRFDAEGFDELKSLGLSLASPEDTTEPDPGYTYGLGLLPPSSDPSVRGTTLAFSYDDVTKTYIPLGGIEQFSGSLVFNVDTTKLALPPELKLGNLSVAFSPDYKFFFSTGTVANGLRLFDVDSSGNPTVDLNSQTWTLEPVSLKISQDFSNYLVAAGASKPTAGLEIIDARGYRSFVEAGATSVPEPDGALPILTAGAALVWRMRKRKAA